MQSQPVPQVSYGIVLPDGFECQSNGTPSGCDLLLNGKTVGGVLICSYPKEFLKTTQPPRILPNFFTSHSDIILKTLKNADAPGTGRPRFDCSIETDNVSDCYIWFGNRQEEYEHHVYFLDDGILTLWFDMTRIEKSVADSLASKFTVHR